MTERLRKEFLAEVHGLINAQFETLGFTQGRDGRYFRPISVAPEVSAWIGVTHLDSDADGTHDALVFVGVEHPVFQELYERLVPGDVSSGAVKNLGDLMPNREPQSWRFGPQRDNPRTAELLAEAAVCYGEPFWVTLVDTKEFSSFIQRTESDASFGYRVPVALLLTGEVQNAQEIVERTLASLPEDGAWAEFYRAFAERFFAYVDSDSGSDNMQLTR
jgi:hypothetical protein